MQYIYIMEWTILWISISYALCLWFVKCAKRTISFFRCLAFTARDLDSNRMVEETHWKINGYNEITEFIGMRGNRANRDVKMNGKRMGILCWEAFVKYCMGIEWRNAICFCWHADISNYWIYYRGIYFNMKEGAFVLLLPVAHISI